MVTHSDLGEDPLWHVYVITVQIVLRILPTVAIFGFNIWIYFKLRGISRRRRRFKQQQMSRRVVAAKRKKNTEEAIPSIVVEPPSAATTEVAPPTATNSSNRVKSALGVTLSAEAALSVISVASDDVISLTPSDVDRSVVETDEPQGKRARWKAKWMGKVAK